MANKIIKIGNKLNNIIPTEPIYVDIDMLSKSNTPIRYDDFYCGLIAEQEDNDLSAIPTEETSMYEDDDKEVLLLSYNRSGSYIYKKDKNNHKYDYKINSSKDVMAVQNSLTNIFRWIPGERIINPEFGSNLRTLLYEGINSYNEQLIVAEIKESISKWEPRVTVVKVINVSDNSNTEDNTIVLNIEYYINGLEDKLYTFQYSYTKNE